MACATLGWIGVAAGQALSVAGGVTQVLGNGNRSYGWAVDYSEPIAGPLEFGLLYLNQGHPNNHHRDGIAPELWLRTPRFGALSFAAGVGPFYYFDTTRERNAAGDYLNLHGLGVVYSALAEWRWHRRWSVILRANRVHAPSSFDTNSFLLGVDYRWERGLADEDYEPLQPMPRHEITAFVGRTIVNSFASQHSLAASVEYRTSLRRWLDWTVSVLNEGDARLIRRDGVVTQLWLVRQAHDDRVSLGVGVGPYFAIDQRNPGTRYGRGGRLAALISFGARYSFAPHWHVRLSWNRVLADYQRDTDVFLAGVGYGF